MAKGTQRAFGGHVRPGTAHFDALVENIAKQPSATGIPNGENGAKPDSTWLRYTNQRATRNQPISPKLQESMQFLGDMGITMEVYSGGQSSHGPNRVGSRRHDHGNSADVLFYKDGRRLDWNRSEDVPVYQEIVRNARARGVTGFGAGPGYMQAGSMHVGFGSPGVWGAGGRGENAPGWLRDAFSGPGGAAKATVNSAPMVSAAGAAADRALSPKASETADALPAATPDAANVQGQRKASQDMTAFLQWTNQVRGQNGQGRMGVGGSTPLSSLAGHQQSRGGGVIQASAAAIAQLVTN